MKIGPALPPPVPQPPTPEGEPARAFDDVLAAMEGATQGFDEVGVFGLGRPTAGPDEQAQRGAAPADTPQPTPELPIEASAPVKAIAAPCDLPTGRALLHHPGQGRDFPVISRGGLDETLAFAGVTEGRRDPVGRTPMQGPARTGRPRPIVARPGPAPGLILTETANGAEVIAGGPPLDAESRAILRRIVRSMLARHGLSLAHFQLNGTSVASDSLETTGGSHGARAR